LSALHVRFISWQILAGLNYLHSANIAHRDLKPSNILVTEDNHVSLIDFGLARQLRALDAEAPTEDKKDSMKSTTAMARKLTQHVVTRWYRPPELILLQGQYSPAVDVWSFGCIFGELVKTLNTSQRGGPLFPGRSSFPSSKDHYKTQDLKNELSKSSHQLTQIFNMIGSPSKSEIAKIKRGDIRQVLLERPVIEPKDLSKVFAKAPAPAVQILGESLKFDPEKRSPVSKLLVNPWFKDVVDRKKMFKASSKMKFPFEDIPRLPSRHEEKDRLRKLIIKEIALVRDGVTE
jgi:mitogen-activated protein kinase 1/3